MTDIQFSDYNLPQLKKIVKQYSEYHTIKNYSKMTKPQLVNALEEHFKILDGNLYKKNVHNMEMPNVELDSKQKSLLQKTNRLQVLYDHIDIENKKLENLDEHLERTDLKASEKAKLKRQFQAGAKRLLKLEAEMEKIEDLLNENDNTKIKRKVVDDNKNRTKEKTIKKMTLQMVSLDGKIQRNKNLLMGEKHPPLIEKLNKQIEEWKQEKKHIMSTVNNLK